jgi:hypothetical protein
MRSLRKQILSTFPSGRKEMVENERDRRNTNLALAAKNNDVKELRKLLREEAFYEIAESPSIQKTMRMALRVAVVNNHSDVVNLLLEHGADPTAKLEDKGKTLIEIYWQSEMLTSLISGAYHHRNHESKPLPDMAQALGKRTALALAKHILVKDAKHHPDPAINMPGFSSLIDYVIGIIKKSKHQHKYSKLSSLLGLYFFNQGKKKRHYTMALSFLTMAGKNNRYVDTKNLRESCYKKLKLAPLLTESLTEEDKEALLPKIKDSHLLKYLKQYAKHNANIHNELGRIYFLLDDVKHSYRHSIKAEERGFQGHESVVRLSHLMDRLPDKNDTMMKYRALCYHLGIGGKDLSEKLAIESLEKALKTDPEPTLAFLGHPKRGLPLAYKVLSHHNYFSLLNIDTAIKLFTEKNVNALLCNEEKAQFLLYCARHYPTHSWVREQHFVSSVAENIHPSLADKLKCHFVIVALLNHDVLTDGNAKSGASLLKLNKEGMKQILLPFAAFFPAQDIEWSKAIIKSYQRIVKHEPFSVAALPYQLDIYGWQHLFRLIKGSDFLKNKHAIGKLIRQAALSDVNRIKSDKTRQEKEVLINTTMKDDLFLSNQTSTIYRMRLFPAMSVRAMKNQFAEDKIERKSLRSS